MSRGARVLILLLIFLPFSGVSCSAGGLSQKLNQARRKVFNARGQSGANFVQNLSEAQKQAIKDWLNSNKLNDYGDPRDSVYAGGTPLFDEATGEIKNRFEHLLEKFPELKDIIKNEISKQIKTEEKKK